MSEPNPPSFRENDLQLLKSGNFADGIIKCQGRTWNIHRALLSSRLKFFRTAFTGPFAEAASGAIDFPEETPDSVDIMIRHLYGEALCVKDLKTPILCVRTWKFAHYLQLDSLKQVAISSLEQHFDAMVLLASSDRSLECNTPTWLGHFIDALQETCVQAGAELLKAMFATFLWVTRYEMLHLPQTMEALSKSADVTNEVMHLLVWHTFKNIRCWVPEIRGLNGEIQERGEILFGTVEACFECGQHALEEDGVRFYNPFPISSLHKGIGELVWCKTCVDNINKRRAWPWRMKAVEWKEEYKVDAWAWADDE